MELLFKASDRLKLRKADLDDSDFAYQVKRAAFREYAERVWGWDEDVQRQLHARRFKTQDLLIISQNGRNVGIMSVSVEPDRVYVKQLYVLPEHQGQGIGRACMSMVIERGNELSLPVGLRVLKVNPRAVAFYERLGFVTVGTTDTHFMMQKAPDSISHATRLLDEKASSMSVR